MIVFGGVFAVLAIAAIAVTSWVLDVAADAPSLATCNPIDRGGNTVDLRRRRREAGDGRLAAGAHAGRDRPRPEEPAAGDGGDRGPALLPARRPRLRGDPARGGQGPGSRRSGRGRLDDHPAAGPQLCIRTRSATSSARSKRRKLAIEYAERHSRKEILGSYLNVASYGTIEGTTAVGVGAASKIFFSKPVWQLKLPEAALLAGLPQAPSEYNPLLDPDGGAKRAATRSCAQMAKLGYVSEERARAVMASGLRVDLDESYFEHREPYFFDYVENKLIEEYGANTVRRGGLEVHTTIEPRAAGSRPRSDALGAALLDRPLLGAGLDRPPQRPDPGDGLQLRLRREQVQPRRPGAPPARLDLQDLRPDDGDPAGDRPLLDLLHLETARPLPAEVGALDGPHRRRRLSGDRQPAAGDGRLRQHRLRPARPRRRPGGGGGDRAPDGDRLARSTGSRPRGSAACGSASRRWRCRAPTQPSPTAASAPPAGRRRQGRLPQRPRRARPKPRSPSRRSRRRWPGR